MLRLLRNLLWPWRNIVAGAELIPWTGNHGDELSHAPGDPLVDLVEHLSSVIHRIVDRARLNRGRIEVAEYQDVSGPAPKTLTNQALLGVVHHHDKIGCADQIGRHESRSVVRQVQPVACGGGQRIGMSRPVEASRLEVAETYRTIVTTFESDPEAPRLSVTVTRIVCVPSGRT